MGRKSLPYSGNVGDKRFCYDCRTEILWVRDFFFDPAFSPHPHHVKCQERIMRHRPPAQILPFGTRKATVTRKAVWNPRTLN